MNNVQTLSAKQGFSVLNTGIREFEFKGQNIDIKRVRDGSEKNLKIQVSKYKELKFEKGMYLFIQFLLNPNQNLTDQKTLRF